MRVRQHRGTLIESLKTVKQIESTKQALVDHINKELGKPFNFSVDSISIVEKGVDERINWNNHLILIDGFGVFGYCDQHPV
ncbi:hypothetical protein A73_48 [Escherichia phage A73]|uniref:Uncharacterized protein n=1 Tax=Escherichia phage A73 TaxID=3003819 RepID=A0AAE9VY48_9CAUD|nr:hypothetical protein A73_48 [Escherichia phage A73]